MRLDGWDRLQRAFMATPDLTVQAVSLALTKVATRVFNESQMQVPFRRGTLSTTGFVSPVAMLGNGQMAITISYGGASAPYAVKQHENLSYRHAPGRKALYLSDPFLEAQPNLERWLLSSIGQSLASVGW